jgi:hypothetical protein
MFLCKVLAKNSGQAHCHCRGCYWAHLSLLATLSLVAESLNLHADLSTQTYNNSETIATFNPLHVISKVHDVIATVEPPFSQTTAQHSSQQATIPYMRGVVKGLEQCTWISHQTTSSESQFVPYLKVYSVTNLPSIVDN